MDHLEKARAQTSRRFRLIALGLLAIGLIFLGLDRPGVAGTVFVIAAFWMIAAMWIDNSMASP